MTCSVCAHKSLLVILRLGIRYRATRSIEHVAVISYEQVGYSQKVPRTAPLLNRSLDITHMVFGINLQLIITDG